MWGEVLVNVIGLVVGLLTGYLFERRSTRDAERHADQLQKKLVELNREMSVLRDMVMGFGGSLPNDSDQVAPAGLIDVLRARAVATQDAEGRVSKVRLKRFLSSRGFKGADIDDEISKWVETDEAEEVEDGKWLRLR